MVGGGIPMNIKINRRKLGKRFAERRNYLGITQQELADMIGSAVNTISKIESQGEGFSVETFFAICSALKTTPNFFLCGVALDLEIVEEVGDELFRLKKPEHFEIISRVVDVLADAENMDKVDVIV